MPSLQEAARALLERQWLSMPLVNDTNGLPKRPILQAWASMDRHTVDIDAFPWAQARGLGIVLGLPSNCLVVLDMDGEQLFKDIVEALGESCPRAVRTARNRGHLYFYETDEISLSGWHEVTWRGEKVRIELKANGTQVAAPPTPGYTLLNSAQPGQAPCIEAAWSWVSERFQTYWGEVPKLITIDPCTGRYPRPWRNHVPAGERNSSAYVEAHRLREAGVSEVDALEFMAHRLSIAMSKLGSNGGRSIARSGVPTRRH